LSSELSRLCLQSSAFLFCFSILQYRKMVHRPVDCHASDGRNDVTTDAVTVGLGMVRPSNLMGREANCLSECLIHSLVRKEQVGNYSALQAQLPRTPSQFHQWHAAKTATPAADISAVPRDAIITNCELRSRTHDD
jgi:hypothetical protein